MAVDYDVFMQLDLRGRITEFSRLTPDDKAFLVRTQVERWIAKNRARLSPEQLAAMEDFASFATAAQYEERNRQAAQARAKELEIHGSQLFSREDMGQALTIHGDHIPPA